MDSSDPKPETKGKDKKEAFHREAESRMVPFSYERPDAVIDRKGVVYLAHSDLMSATVQVIPEGGDNNMHYHPHSDGFWMVLQGKCRFYGPDGVIGEYGPYEGLTTPRNSRYWFETADKTQELHLLHINANTQNKTGKGRINVDEQPAGHQKNLRFNYPPGVRPGD
jgi:mannose-6-phosphate isomerase-like protein (cupin superfamily)